MKSVREQVKHLPGVGQRMVRSVCALFLCFVVYELRGRRGIPFYSALAALQCIQPYMESSTRMAKQRIGGTLVGAAWGLLVLLFLTSAGRAYQGTLLIYGLISLLTGAVLYSTVLLNLKFASYFSCVVFLSITINHMSDQNPYLFVYNRVADTLIGVVVAMAANTVQLPRVKDLDTLFVSGVDDVLLTPNKALTPYSKIELNRIIDSGANVTLATLRTPASLMDVIDGIHLKLPVIVMGGAALYDMKENAYLMVRTLPYQQIGEIIEILKLNRLNYFSNVIIDDLLIIYYEQLENVAEREIFQKLRRSPYRNYVKRKLPEGEEVIYFMTVAEEKQIKTAYQMFQDQKLDQKYKIMIYDSMEYSGYTYMKIFQKDADQTEMCYKLKEMLKLDACMIFGNENETCDVVIEDSGKDTMVKQLKQAFEPVWLWRRKGRKQGMRNRN